MEIDIIGAQEELALAHLIEQLTFRRCNRLAGQMAPLEMNTLERKVIQEQYERTLLFANHAQLAKQQAQRKLFEVWASREVAPIFEALTRLDLPNTEDPIITLIGPEPVTLDRLTVADWIADELTRLKAEWESKNDPQR
ncbi:MAG: hypothetical protein EBZ75_13850 [Oxalobacteraceae bacterium]|nr:hypothetical protein [Oxalobacteraceae bacterium]